MTVKGLRRLLVDDHFYSITFFCWFSYIWCTTCRILEEMCECLSAKSLTFPLWKYIRKGSIGNNITTNDLRYDFYYAGTLTATRLPYLKYVCVCLWELLIIGCVVSSTYCCIFYGLLQRRKCSPVKRKTKIRN